MSFNYPDRIGADAIAKSMGYECGKIVKINKGWRIHFGDDRYSHDEKGVPATQLKQWIAGAVSVLGVAKAQFDAAKKMRDEKIQDLIPEGDELVDALRKECEANAVGTTEMTDKLFPFMDGSALTVRDVANLAENVDSDLRVWTSEDLEDYVSDATSDAIADTAIYKISARIAYSRDDNERQSELMNLRHELAYSHNVHHPYLI